MKEKYKKFYKTFHKKFKNYENLILCSNTLSHGGIENHGCSLSPVFKGNL